MAQVLYNITPYALGDLKRIQSSQRHARSVETKLAVSPIGRTFLYAFAFANAAEVFAQYATPSFSPSQVIANLCAPIRTRNELPRAMGEKVDLEMMKGFDQ